jgi:hypothetical protein
MALIHTWRLAVPLFPGFGSYLSILVIGLSSRRSICDRFTKSLRLDNAAKKLIKPGFNDSVIYKSHTKPSSVGGACGLKNRQLLAAGLERWTGPLPLLPLLHNCASHFSSVEACYPPCDIKVTLVGADKMFGSHSPRNPNLPRREG